MRATHISVRLAAAMLVVSLTGAYASAARIRRGPTAPKVRHTSKKSSSHTRATTGPRGIDDSRATQIQHALIKAGYMTGEPSGHWDATTQAAMEKLQSDNGWQTKLIPDSRALIKLGLGPGHDVAAPATANMSNATTTASATNNE